MSKPIWFNTIKRKILGNGVIFFADFEPCELKDGRAIFNTPTYNLKFVFLHIDKKGNNHEAAIVTKQNIQSLSKDMGIYIANFDDKMIRKIHWLEKKYQ